MSAPKTKSASAANGSAKLKTPSTSGSDTPPSRIVESDDPDQLAAFAGGRPDKNLHEAEQARIKSEIDILQVKLSDVRDKISFATKSGPGNDRRNELRAELDSIRDKQSTNKSSKGKSLDQIKAIQEGIQKKIKDLQAAKSKTPFKTVEDVDAHIKNLDKQVESGNMKLADEKRALQEISTTKRSRKIVEGFQAEEESIQADRQKIDELRKELDDPANIAISERYDAIKAELDALKKDSDIAYAGRNKLFEERDKLQAQLRTLFNEKRDSGQRYREANDRYYTKLNEDRARRAEKARAQRAADEAAKKKEIAERLLEEAQLPAFQAQIEDCQTLIDFLSGKSTGNLTYKSLAPKAEVVGVPKLELRKVEDAPEGVIVRKKKGEEENDYFVGGGGKSKGKGKKGGKAPAAADSTQETTPPASSTSLNIPLPTLSALLLLSIPPPASNVDVPRVIEDLNTKKAWYEANQARVTADNVAKAEKEIARLAKGEIASKDLTPPNGGGENPAEPTSTPQVGVTETVPIRSEAVVDKLDAVYEDEAAQ